MLGLIFRSRILWLMFLVVSLCHFEILRIEEKGPTIRYIANCFGFFLAPEEVETELMS